MISRDAAVAEDSAEFGHKVMEKVFDHGLPQYRLSVR